MSLRFLLVIPFYNGDKGQVQRLGKWMNQLSGGKKIGDKILFCASPITDPIGVGDNFVGLFDEIKGHRQVIGPDLLPNQNPWPKAPNYQFIQLAKHIYEERKDIDAFYYMEADNLPLTPDWWEKLCADYEKQGKPFYGAHSSYIERISDAAPRLNGKHMIGTGIYPQDAWKRIKGFQTIEEEQPNSPWDAFTRDEINPQCHFTDLIHHVHGSRGYRKDWTAIYRGNLQPEFKRQPVNLSPNAVVLHGCKDASLRLVMGERLGLPQTDTLTFCHAGDIGDLIYCMASMKSKGVPIQVRLSGKGYSREQMTIERCEAIAPLLLSQSYIDSAVHHDDSYVDFDMRGFRALHKQHTNLVQDQADWSGSPADCGKNAWITGIPEKRLYQYVVNRTPRYRNDKFPWKAIAVRDVDACFIGSDEEYDEMHEIWERLAYFVTPNFLDAAKVIAGSQIFLGNQSACFAIAEAIKHPRIQETCPEAKDCIFDSKTGTYCLDGRIDLSKFGGSSDETPTQTDIDELLKNPKLTELIDNLIQSRLDALIK